MSGNPGVRKIGLRIGLAAAVAALTVFPVLAAQDDHGDTPATATPVVIGVTTSGSIEVAGDNDFFSFTAPANSYLRIETFNLLPLDTGGDSCDTVIALYASDGTTILAEDDQSGSEQDASKILWPNSTTQTLYLEIYHFYSTGTGKYNFIIEANELPSDDHGNTADSTATPLVLNASSTLGEVELPGDVDFFRFSLAQGIFYDLETSELSDESDTLLAFFDTNGQTILVTDDQSGRETNASRIVMKAPSSGVFYARVSQFASSGLGEYRIAIREEGPAVAIVPDGTKVAGTLSEAGDIDVYSLDAAARHLYRIELITGNFLNRFKLRLLDSDGRTLLAQNDFATSQMTWQAPSSNTFYLVIREDVEGGHYDLSALDQGTPPPDADLNDDYQVDHQDLLLFHAQWQTVYPTPTP